LIYRHQYLQYNDFDPFVNTNLAILSEFFGRIGMNLPHSCSIRCYRSITVDTLGQDFECQGHPLPYRNFDARMAIPWLKAQATVSRLPGYRVAITTQMISASTKPVRTVMPIRAGDIAVII